VWFSQDEHKHTYISVALSPVPKDMRLEDRETERGKELLFGMFTRGTIPWYRYLFCGGRTG
jgi:hypothetical protein